ncbi:MAG: lamin tail domain-containing protein [Byssovorax sp.]
MKRVLVFVPPLFVFFALQSCGSPDPAGVTGAGGASATTSGTGGSGADTAGSGGHGGTTQGTGGSAQTTGGIGGVGGMGGAGGDAPPLPLELCINELMPRNIASAADEGGNYADWIELHNPGKTPIDLAGWALTDDASMPFKSVLPAGLTLPPKGFLLLWADGTPQVGASHLGFKLDAKGGVVGVFAPDGRGSLVSYGEIAADFSAARNPDCCQGPGCFTFVFRGTPGKTNVFVPPVTVSLLQTGSVFHYLDQDQPPDPSWTTAAFDDSALPSGPAPLGYGDPHIVTTVSYGPDPNAKHITTWFRTTFLAADHASFTSATLKILRDDGARAFLNGTEIARTNLPDGDIDAATLAPVGVGGAEETAFFGFAIDPALFVDGPNVLAVEVHQAAATSSDLGFDAEITAVMPGSPP